MPEVNRKITFSAWRIWFDQIFSIVIFNDVWIRKHCSVYLYNLLKEHKIKEM